MSNQKSVKITYDKGNGEIVHRRLPPSESFFEFMNLILDCFQIQGNLRGSYMLGYVDEEKDFILVSSEIEWSGLKGNYSMHFYLRKRENGNKNEVNSSLSNNVVLPKPQPEIYPSKKPESFREEYLNRKVQHKLEKIQFKIEEKQKKLEYKASKLMQDKNKPEGWKKMLNKSVRIVEENESNLVSAGSKFSAVWKLRNEGSFSWKNLQVLFKRGDKLGISDSVSVQNEVGPNEEVSIVIPMQAPLQSGRYVCVFKLALGGIENSLFGPPLKVIAIVPSSFSESDSSEEEEVPKSLSFGEKMKLLTNLGYLNEQKNAKLLSKFQGNVDQVIFKYQKMSQKKLQKKNDLQKWSF